MLIVILNKNNTRKKTENQLTNFIVYDLGTHNTDGARPYNTNFYRLGKLTAKYNRDCTQDELDRCRKGTLVFDADNCISNAIG